LKQGTILKGGKASKMLRTTALYTVWCKAESYICDEGKNLCSLSSSTSSEATQVNLAPSGVKTLNKSTDGRTADCDEEFFSKVVSPEVLLQVRKRLKQGENASIAKSKVYIL